ncbi:MAG: 30S ribosome-binding factor RbfA [Clostridiales bacterium]|nr:30S ribosome-binding factor RbfA [Clostridiales bacterium]
MPSYRINRINEDIQRELSALLRTVKDPRVGGHMLSVVRVDTATDLSVSKIYVSALDCADEKELRKGLKSTAGYLRRELSRTMNLRHTPELQFIVDHSIDEGAHILHIMDDLEAKEHERE